MGLDIRWPIGLMFSLVGLIMTVFGLATNGDAEMYHRSLDININLIWGIVLLVFGGFMLWMAMRGKGDPGSPEKK
jgi:putative Mn2+ efflux pump MntP